MHLKQCIFLNHKCRSIAFQNTLFVVERNNPKTIFNNIMASSGPLQSEMKTKRAKGELSTTEPPARDSVMFTSKIRDVSFSHAAVKLCGSV